MATKEDWICACGYPNEYDIKECEGCGKSQDYSKDGNIYIFIFLSGNGIKRRTEGHV